MKTEQEKRKEIVNSPEFAENVTKEVNNILYSKPTCYERTVTIVFVDYRVEYSITKAEPESGLQSHNQIEAVYIQLGSLGEAKLERNDGLEAEIDKQLNP